MKKLPVDRLLLEAVRIKGETTTQKDLEKGMYGEKAISDFFAEYSNQLSLDVKQDDFGNVIAVMDKGRGKIINFNGHMDTKPVPEDLKPEIRDGHVYGRGSADMRGGIAAMLDSVPDLMKEKIRGKIVYTFVVCEESGETDIRQRGTPSVIKYLQEHNLIPNASIVGESSQSIEKRYTLCDGERGRYTTTIAILGESSHGAWGSHLGVNADIIASKIVQEIFNLDRSGEIEPYTNINVQHGDIKDRSYNLVPDNCPVLIDIRYPAKAVLKKTKRHIKEIIEKNLKSANYQTTEENFMADPCNYADSEMKKILLETYKSVTGTEPRVMKSMFGTDGRFIRKLLGDIPIYIAGPGFQEMAHTPNESVPIEHLINYSKIYTETVKAYMTE